MFHHRLLVRMRWEVAEVVEALATWRFYRTLLTMAVGVTLGATAINGILIPRHLFAPGTSGISLLVFYLAGWPSVGVIYFLLNIPLFVIGWREYALKYVIISGIGVLMFSGSLILTEDIVIPAHDPLMASILGGLLMGIGSGLYLRFGGSAGGLDILATYIRKKVAVPMGTTLNAVNVFNLVGALILFDLPTAFYSGVFMWVNSWTLEKVQSGFSQHRALFIVTSRPEEVGEGIRKRLNRGVTFLEGMGGFSHKPLLVVYSVINMYELGRVKDLLYEIDPEAYLMVNPTSEVIGRRFHTWEDEGYRRRSVPPVPDHFL
jgi:uncharacterized membrane-anchored protein YitT (DUF2179 family)